MPAVNVQRCLEPIILLAGVVMVCANALLLTTKTLLPSSPCCDCGPDTGGLSVQAFMPEELIVQRYSLGCGSAGHAAGQARESTIPKSILAILIVLGANICRVYCRDWNRLCLDWVSKQRTGKASTREK